MNMNPIMESTAAAILLPKSIWYWDLSCGESSLPIYPRVLWKSAICPCTFTNHKTPPKSKIKPTPSMIKDLVFAIFSPSLLNAG